jgi:hypothetical protein
VQDPTTNIQRSEASTMNISQIFINLSPFLRDRFTSEVFTLGLVHELNQKQFEVRCKRLIRQHNGETRKLYKALSRLNAAERLRFFDVVSGADDGSQRVADY